jgi:hypothetical protein
MYTMIVFEKYKSGPIRTEFQPKYLHRKVSNDKQTARKTERFMADRHGRLKAHIFKLFSDARPWMSSEQNLSQEC